MAELTLLVLVNLSPEPPHLWPLTLNLTWMTTCNTHMAFLCCYFWAKNHPKLSLFYGHKLVFKVTKSSWHNNLLCVSHSLAFSISLEISEEANIVTDCSQRVLSSRWNQNAFSMCVCVGFFLGWDRRAESGGKPSGRWAFVRRRGRLRHRECLIFKYFSQSVWMFFV